MAKCKSCGKEIIWIKMASGKMMPCDADKISFDLAISSEGSMSLVTPDGKVARGIFNPNGEYIGYISHFATCPNASKHRKK